MAEPREPDLFLQDHPVQGPHPVAEKMPLSDVGDGLLGAIEALCQDPDGAVALAEHAVARARQSDDPRMLARSLHRAASLLCVARYPTRAYVLGLEAQLLLEQLDDRWRATKVLQIRGRCCLTVGEYDRAQALLAEAAERFSKMSDPVELARCHALIALAQCRRGELPQALESATHAVATLPAEDHLPLQQRLRYVEAWVRLQLGHRHAHEGRAARAREEYARAFYVLPDLRDVDRSCWFPTGFRQLDSHAQIAWAHGESDITQRALRTLILWVRRWKNPSERGRVWMRLAEFHQQQGRHSAALACAARAVGWLSALRGEPQLPGALMLLADLLEAAGNLQGAYEAFASATGAESQQQREAMAVRAELLALDQEAEQDLRKSEQTLAYGQRLSNVGHLVASVNHELNQPMASIRMLAEISLELIDQGEHGAAQDNVRSMLKLSGRLTDMASKLAAFPAPSEAGVHRVCLIEVVNEALATLRSRLVHIRCEIVQDLQPMTVRAQEAQLVRVVANLVNNALDVVAYCELPRIVFACSAVDGVATLSVSDSGPGLSEEVRDRLFQPFFSTKPAGQGLGLGLAVSRDVMREMGGDLTARGGVEGGAVFEIRLPLAPCLGVASPPG